MINLKDIHIGKLVETKWIELDISMERTRNFFKYEEEQIKKMFIEEDMNTEDLLKWCKLLEYDFFRLYSQHLILYSPPSSVNYYTKGKVTKPSLPVFRKNLYTQDMITFILELLDLGEKTKREIIDEYRIPKTTLYKWIDKYNQKD